MPPLPETPAPKRTSALGKIGPVSVSLLLHVALMLVIGGAVIIEQVIPKSSFKPAMLGESFDQQTETETPVEEEMKDPSASNSLDLPSDAVSMPEASNSDSMDTIAVETPVSSPSWIVAAGTAAATPGINATKPTGGGNGTGTGTGKKIVGNIFGKQVEASRLGVLLDISGSGHGSLLAAMTEVEKSFENSPIVMAFGCGMDELKSSDPAIVDVYGKMKPDKDKDKPGSRNSLGQLAMAEMRYKDLEKYLARLKKRDDVFAIYGGDISVTQLGFQKLIEQGCDTIYWFCDFQDPVQAKIFDNLLKELKRKNIKVITHNFTGNPVPPQQTKMSTETGGETITRKP